MLGKRGTGPVITGIAVATPMASTPEDLHAALCAGRSALGRWTSFDASPHLLKVGGDIGGEPLYETLEALKAELTPRGQKSLRRMLKTLPWSLRWGLLVAGQAWKNAGLFTAPPQDSRRVSVVAAGHVINGGYIQRNAVDFSIAPERAEAMFALNALDSIHASAVSEMLGTHGGVCSLGSACASGLYALRYGMMEILCGQADVVVVHAPIAEISALDLHSMAVMGTVTLSDWPDPTQASRPFDLGRNGFVPAHGVATVILEAPEHARHRRASPLAELCGIAVASDGCHLPLPNADGEARVMAQALAQAGIAPHDIGFISAHATSTPAGDCTEIAALRQVFGEDLPKIPINAPKANLGHCLWSAPLVELVAAILQLQRGEIHPTRNLVNPDPAIDGLQIWAQGVQRHDCRFVLKNSFGFGGTNAACVLGHPDR